MVNRGVSAEKPVGNTVFRRLPDPLIPPPFFKDDFFEYLFCFKKVVRKKAVLGCSKI